MKTPSSCIENYINGNLTDSKKQAKRFSSDRLITYLHIDLGWSALKAIATAKYLKGRGSLQEACNTE